MKVAISSSGKDLEALIDPRFGRCPYFLLVETGDMGFEVLDNENCALRGGAGIQTAQLVASRGVRAVVTGRCGPNAMRALSAAGIQVFAGHAGTVKDALEKFKKEQLSPAIEAGVPGKSAVDGLPPGRDPGMTGRNRSGRGMGMGGGRGRGMGMGGMGMGGRGMGGRCMRMGARWMAGNTGYTGRGKTPGFGRYPG